MMGSKYTFDVAAVKVVGRVAETIAMMQRLRVLDVLLSVEGLQCHSVDTVQRGPVERVLSGAGSFASCLRLLL